MCAPDITYQSWFGLDAIDLAHGQYDLLCVLTRFTFVQNTFVLAIKYSLCTHLL